MDGEKEACPFGNALHKAHPIDMNHSNLGVIILKKGCSIYGMVLFYTVSRKRMTMRTTSPPA
jgi:hypothetical protein